MDPVSVIGLVSSLVSICDVIRGSLSRLRTLQSNFKSSSLDVSLLIGQLNTLKAALDQTIEWVSSSLVNVPHHQQLVTDLNISLESCQILVSILEDRIVKLEWDIKGNLDFKAKLTFAWEKSGLNDFMTHLNNQSSALNLLLTALNCVIPFNEVKHDRELEPFRYRIRIRPRDYRNQCIQGCTEIQYEECHMERENSLLPNKIPGGCGPANYYSGVGRENLLVSDAQSVHTSEPSQEPTPSALREHSVFRNSFPPNRRFVKTPQIDRFSSRLSEVGSIFMSGRTDSVYFFDSQKSNNASQQLDSTFNPLLPLSDKAVRESQIGRRKAGNHLKGFQMPRKIIKVETPTLADEEAPISVSLPGQLEQLSLRMAFLGTRHSGRSTAFRAIKTFSKGGWTIEERLSFKEVINANMEEAMRVQGFSLNDKNPELEKRIKEANYIPSDEDILRACIKTLGVYWPTVKFGDTILAMADTAGARCERRKWKHAYMVDNLDILIYTVDVSAYDRVMDEDLETNRMEEDCNIFADIYSKSLPLKARIILLFTKLDLLERKIGIVSFKKYMTGFIGNEKNVDDVKHYIKALLHFQQRRKKGNNCLYKAV
ncbi:hypothetical protein G7Y89_g7892 [Cudoniella acicularis]|uniref:Uncharacterized protein n=1 Tax=Cudoniella acicularis TaxID=354080 RepID=A0A8H4RHN7_9HELO|nr:hypothetical protein G7Y89_g7892 [Cudoniella acicularis]